MALLGSVAAMLWLPLLIYLSPSRFTSVLLSVILVVYLTRKVLLFFQDHQALKQLRMEAHFTRQNFTPEHLRACLAHNDHLWTRSCIVQGLRASLLRPLPDSVPKKVTEHHYARLYHKAFQGLRPNRFSADLPVLVLLLLGWIVLVTTGTLPTGNYTLLASIPALALMLIAETGRALFQRQTHSEFIDFEHALAHWTRTEAPLRPKRPALPKRYIHHLLYLAPSLRSTPTPSLVEAA